MVCCLCGERLLVVLNNLSSVAPHAELTGKSLARLSCHHPSQCLHGEVAERIQRNSCQIIFSAGWDPEFPEIRAALTEPPSKKVPFLEALARDWVIDDGGWFITQPLTSIQEPVTKFRVSVTEHAGTTTIQISSESAVFLEHLLS